MTAYTDSASRPGIKGTTGTDDTELFLRQFGDMVFEAYEESFDFMGRTTVRPISSGKSQTFPIIGRKRDAADHTPGEQILGGTIEHNEIEVTLDPMLVDSLFLPEIDELMAHYPLSAPYARQIGHSLASSSNRKIGHTFINASRVIDPPYEDGPVPGYFFHANMRTDPAQLEEAAFKAVEHIRTNDISGEGLFYMLPHAQYILLAKWVGIDQQDTSGSGNRAAGTVGKVAGIQIEGTNSIPTGNVTTYTGRQTKYNGNFTNTVGLIANAMAVATVKRRGIRVTMKDKDDRLGTLIIGSKLEGHGIQRAECAFEITTTERV
jgi:hypothetical protein